MDKIILDQAMLAKIGQLDRVVELCDESGRVLGVFCPADNTLYSAIAAPTGDDESRQAGQEAGGFTIAQLLDHLHSLSRPEND